MTIYRFREMHTASWQSQDSVHFETVGQILLRAEPRIAMSALALIGAQSLGISVSLVLASDLPAIPIERLAIQQVIVNLIRNAVDAMAASATRLLQITTRSAASMIEVIVADTGPGLAPEIAARLFEPFVTTKPDGLGIGLSIWRSIAEDYRGHLSAEANPGAGTIFRLALPTTESLEPGASALAH